MPADSEYQFAIDGFSGKGNVLVDDVALKLREPTLGRMYRGRFRWRLVRGDSVDSARKCLSSINFWASDVVTDHMHLLNRAPSGHCATRKENALPPRAPLNCPTHRLPHISNQGRNSTGRNFVLTLKAMTLGSARRIRVLTARVIPLDPETKIAGYRHLADPTRPHAKLAPNPRRRGGQYFTLKSSKASATPVSLPVGRLAVERKQVPAPQCSPETALARAPDLARSSPATREGSDRPSEG